MSIGTTNEVTRHAWVIQVLKNLPAGLRILDAGAGELRYKPYCQHLQYIAQDFAQYDGKGDGAGLQTGEWDQTRLDIVCDIAKIPEPDQSFGAILCTEVFEHIPHPIQAIQEFSRLLKPNGVLILTAPFCSFTHFAPYHFYSGFNRYFYERVLPEHQLKVIECTPNGNFFEYVAQEIRRSRSMAKLYGKYNLKMHELGVFYLALRILARLSSKGIASSEFACYGYHVRAIKL